MTSRLLLTFMLDEDGLVFMLPATGLAMSHLFAARLVGGFSQIYGTLTEHPAVTTLGCDLVLSIISSVTWRLAGIYLQPKPRMDYSLSWNKESKSRETRGLRGFELPRDVGY
jgi:hypothetical protein